MPGFIDSHAHLDLCDDPEAAVKEAFDQGVTHILAVGFDLETSARAVQIAKEHEGINAAVGVHPHDAADFDEEAMAELTRLAREPKVVAIGETGLDYYRDRSPRDKQKQSFVWQLELAAEMGLTAIVHSREAALETLEILSSVPADQRVVLHCFSLTEHLQECVDAGFFMSVAGNVTFTNAEKLRRTAARIPEELLLTETDSPWLTPVPLRGKPNRPANVRFVTQELANLRQTPLEQLAGRIEHNFLRAFPGR
jgi:TatD DNase family protein